MYSQRGILGYCHIYIGISYLDLIQLDILEGTQLSAHLDIQQGLDLDLDLNHDLNHDHVHGQGVPHYDVRAVSAVLQFLIMTRMMTALERQATKAHMRNSSHELSFLLSPPLFWHPPHPHICNYCHYHNHFNDEGTKNDRPGDDGTLRSV